MRCTPPALANPVLGLGREDLHEVQNLLELERQRLPPGGGDCGGGSDGDTNDDVSVDTDATLWT